ncbi:tetratricopeptide repeat protein [Pyxidicoccus sp. 3LG]
MDGERVIGTASGGPCGFKPDTEVLSGEFQDNVLVGTLRLCQVGGPDCEPQVQQPVLAIFNPQDRVLSALVRLPAGCGSQALKDNSLLVLKATAAPQVDGREVEAASPEAEDEAPEAGAREAVTPPSEPSSSAAQVAQARKREPEVPPLEEGQRQLAAGNHTAAQTLFEHVLEKEPRNPAALVGLAASQLGRNDVAGALRSLGAAKSSTRPDVHLWMAYAHLREGNRFKSREALRRAMDLGWAPGNRPAEAVPELALREDIKQLMQQGRKRAPSREPTGSGSTSP